MYNPNVDQLLDSGECVTTIMNACASRHIWMRHAAYERVTSHMNVSSHKWVTSHTHASRHRWMSHVTYEWRSHVWGLRWMYHPNMDKVLASVEWVTSHMHSSWVMHMWRDEFVTCEAPNRQAYRYGVATISRLLRRSHVSSSCIKCTIPTKTTFWDPLHESRHVWRIHVTYECIMPRCTSQVTYEHLTYACVTSQMHESRHKAMKESCLRFVNRMYHPNVDELSGSVCLDVINQSWSPMFGIVFFVSLFCSNFVLLYIFNLLSTLTSQIAIPPAFCITVHEYGISTISRLLKILGLFCKRAL